jgi:hypothetical protein
MNIARPLMCSLVIVFVALGLGSYASGSTASNDMSELVRISTLRLGSLNTDKATWGRYTSNQYEGIDDNGQINTKAQMMAEKPSSYPLTEKWVGRPSVRFIGETALVIGKEIETENFPGGTLVSNFRRAEIWAREHGEWMEQATQLTVLQKNYAKGMTNPPTALAAFTGRYEWAPGLIETLSISGARLISTFEGSSDPLIFVSRDAVTEPDDLGVGTFYRDTTGKMAGYVYQRCDGQTIHIPRLAD